MPREERDHAADEPSIWARLGAIVLGLVLAVAMEKTYVGRLLGQMTYQLLQHQLSVPGAAVELPISVVDIHGLVPNPYGSTHPGIPVTPRPNLQDLIEAILAHRPRGIAVDIDFAPDEEKKFLAVQDPEFLDYCLEKSRDATLSTRIRVGIERTLHAQPKDWLRDEKYQRLAGNIASSDVSEDLVRMPLSILAPDSKEESPSLAAAVTAVTSEESITRPWWAPPWAAR